MISVKVGNAHFAHCSIWLKKRCEELHNGLYNLFFHVSSSFFRQIVSVWWEKWHHGLMIEWDINFFEDRKPRISHRRNSKTSTPSLTHMNLNVTCNSLHFQVHEIWKVWVARISYAYSSWPLWTAWFKKIGIKKYNILNRALLNLAWGCPRRYWRYSGS